MSIYLDEIKNLTLYKREFYIPVNNKNRRKGSVIFLLTPDYSSSIKLMNNKFVKNNKMYDSYYIEKDVSFIINHENKLIPHNTDVMNEEDIDFKPTTVLSDSFSFNNISLQTQKNIIFFNENSDYDILNEADPSMNVKLKRLLYNERIKSNKECIAIYNKVKEDNQAIKKTFLNYKLYNGFNLFIDWSYYTQAFFKNNIYKLTKGLDLYFDFVSRFLNDKRLNEYTNKTVFVPISDWVSHEDASTFWDYKKNISPISAIFYLLVKDPERLKTEWPHDFVFFGDTGYFKVNFNQVEKQDLHKIKFLMKILIDKSSIDDDANIPSAKAIMTQIIDRLQDKNITINNLTGPESMSKEELDIKISKLNVNDGGDKNIISSEDIQDERKELLVSKIKKIADESKNEDEVIDTLEHDEQTKQLILDIISDEDDNVKLNATRVARINKINDEFLSKKVGNKTIKELITVTNEKTITKTALPIKSINKEWKEMTYMNFEKEYDLESDIFKSLYHFSKVNNNQIGILGIETEDVSNSESYLIQYIVKCEDSNGKRFTLKFQVPKFKNGRFMRIGGNDKVINGQLMSLPIIKTDEDTVQIVSNYNKIFVRRYGTNTGKSMVGVDRTIKALDKYEGNNIEVILGDNSRVCSKYDLPIDYIDFSSNYSKIIIKKDRDTVITFYFNQDEIRKQFKTDPNKLPLYTIGTKVFYHEDDPKLFTFTLLNYLNEIPEFSEIYERTSVASKYTYAKASILNTEIPVIVIMSYNEGLQTALKKGNINYMVVNKREQYNKNMYDMISFNDAYLIYEINQSSSLLMNGLKECDTRSHSIKEINNKAMWTEFLDNFGGRIKADGLDNFYDCMMDPITVEVCEKYNLPSDYNSALAYANFLLIDNKYNKHTDLSGNRYRSNEIIAGYVYKCLANSYGEYRNQLKRNRSDVTMSIKPSIIVDSVMMDPTCSDLSKLNPLLESESANAVSFKGLSGMNSDRSYDLDKRTFDKSMLNILAMSTGFAGNVGVTRQATIDMNIEGMRGYIKTINNPDNLSVTKSLSITEALTPFGTTRDDPFRTAMTFIQTSKHGMRVKNASPSLIINGAEQALPYLTSDIFAFKAKDDGVITEKTDDYMVITYNGKAYAKKSEFVDLRENVEKNSDGGFYITLKLDSDLKKGDKVTPNQIVAYDKSSYSNITSDDNKSISYSIGTLAKVAMMVTDDGFEDSAIITEWLSDAMTSDVVVDKSIYLPKESNVYQLVKKGQQIQEGEPLIIFQNAYDEKDANALLKAITDKDLVSELGRISVKSKITGVVQDISVYRTVELDDMSSSLKNIVKHSDSNIKKIKEVLKKNNIEGYHSLDPDYKLEPVGKLKNDADGVRIDFYLKYKDKMSVGDKLVYYSALKGVVKDIYPKGMEPTSEFRPDEQVHSLLSIASINARMVGSVKSVISLNKVLIELDRKVKDIMSIKYKNLEDILKQ